MVVASLLLLLLVVAAFIWQGQRSRVTFFPPGKTNGYVILIQAARALTGPDPSTLKTNLQEAAALNQPSLNLMRQALAFDAECPPHLYADPIQYSREIQALRQLSLLAQCEGRLFEQNGEWNKAAVTYIDVIRFGRSVEHCPSASLHLGLATQSSAILSLSNVAHRLTRGEKQAIAARLAELPPNRPHIRQVFARDRYRARHTYREYPVHQLITSGMFLRHQFGGYGRQTRVRLEQSHAEIDQLIRHLRVAEPGAPQN